MSNVYQLKIKILNTKPVIWRRVLVNDYCTFWDIHVIIQGAYEWTDEQPHYWKITYGKNKNIIIKSYIDDYENNDIPLSWNICIKKYLINERYKIFYVYGTDENHTHQIILEKKLYRDLHVKYPKCIAGSGFPDEEDSLDSSEDDDVFSKQMKSIHKFKPSDVVVTKGQRALGEHKIKLFDQLFS